jgi:hypothetical protein
MCGVQVAEDSREVSMVDVDTNEVELCHFSQLKPLHNGCTGSARRGSRIAQ